MRIAKHIVASALLLTTFNAAADAITDQLASHGRTEFPAWLNNPTVISAVKAQNAENAGLSNADIDALDKKWRAETKNGNGPTIDAKLSNDLSAYLKKVKADAQGLYTEIFVMDNKGLNVGQSDVTSDYWQGDEAKWQKTFQVGPDAVHVSEVEQDESTQVFQSQVSLPIVDDGKVIGAVTVGINVDQI